MRGSICQCLSGYPRGGKDCGVQINSTLVDVDPINEGKLKLVHLTGSAEFTAIAVVVILAIILIGIPLSLLVIGIAWHFNRSHYLGYCSRCICTGSFVIVSWIQDP